MSDTTTTTTVTRVRDLPDDGEVFVEGTDNVLWQDAQGTYYTTSWAPGPDGTEYPGDTVVYVSDETGMPTDESMPYFTFLPFPEEQLIEGEQPDHTAALAALNLVPVEE